jgi:hypothetical protein
MKHYFELGGVERPVLFGFAALYQYEQRTGRNALKDFAAMQGGEASITLLVDLLYSGLCAGSRSDGEKIDFEPQDVAEWIGGDFGIFEKVAKAFTEAFPPADGEKKKMPLKVRATA